MKLVFKERDEYVDIKIHDGETGNLIDPDDTPTFAIYDPDGNLVCSGVGIRVGLGRYRAYFRIPENSPYGVYNIVWETSVKGTPIRNQIDQFELISPNRVDITKNISIEPQWLAQVKSIIGYPNLDGFVVTDDQIKEFCIFPAMYQYFLKFPKEQREQYSVSGHLEIDFPDLFVYGIMDIRFVNKGYMDRKHLSIFDFLVYKNMYMPMQWGTYGSPYDFNGMGKNPVLSRELFNTLKNYSNFNYQIDQHNRKLIVNSDRSVELYVSWAKYSLLFDDVLYEFKLDVIRLAQAYLLLYIVDSFQLIQDENLSRRVNTDSLKSRADDIMNKILEKWDSMSYPIFIRF